MKGTAKVVNSAKRKNPRGTNGSAEIHAESRLQNGGDSQRRHVLITGGAGFIGSNLADRLLSSGYPVLIFDNLSRRGVENNVEWLAGKHGSRLTIEEQDIRNVPAVELAVREAAAVFHFAAQVAVTDSLIDPRRDFEINTLGTLNVLEAVRKLRVPPPLIFTSTNKVYGGLSDLKLESNDLEYRPAEGSPLRNGISEDRPIDFESPYGCSKGAADQYVRDYARTFKLPAAVFRMSCIYGPHQFGTEDQGWVAHFLNRASQKLPIAIYGDGKQVRDLLFIDDLVNAFLLALDHIEQISGQAFNMGGGPDHALSLLAVLDLIGELKGHSPAVQLHDWRQGDQRYYVSDTTKFSKATGWRPEINTHDGIACLNRWMEDSHASVFETARRAGRSHISAVRTSLVHPNRAPASAPTSS